MSTGSYLQKWTGGAPSRGYFEYRVWRGSNAPAAEKATGKFKPRPYSLSVTRVNSPKIQVRHRSHGSEFYNSYANEFYLSVEFRQDPWTSNHWNSLVSELYAKVKGGDFNATVATAQLGETLGSITNAATRIYRAYRFARKGRLRDAAVALTGSNKKRLSNKAATKEMASNWLELQYGWLPLLGDVHAGAELLANTLSRPTTRVVRVRRQVTDYPRLDARSGVLFGKVINRHRAQIIAYLTEDLTGYETLGLTDPFTVAWELLPYSFVLDWFLPIGTWLEAANAARTLKGTFVVTHTFISRVDGLFSGNRYEIRGGDSYFSEIFYMSREVSNALVAQIPSFRPLAKVATLHRTLNALALLESLRR